MTCPRCGRPSVDCERFCAGCGLDRAAAGPHEHAPVTSGGVPTTAPFGGWRPDTTAGGWHPVGPPDRWPNVDPQPGWAPDRADAPHAVVEEPGSAPERPRRRRRRLVPAVAAGALLLAGGVAGAVVLLSSGGASSPEEAVTDLAAAISAEDPVGAVAALDPDEAGQLDDVYSFATERSRDLGLDTEVEPDTFLAGFDVEVSDLTTDTQLLADGVARVELTGGVLSWDLESTGMSEGLRGYVERAQSGPWSSTGDVSTADLADAGLPAFVVVVDHGDGWYVSPAYTAAQYWVELQGLPAGDFAQSARSVGAAGADTPEAAVTDLVSTLARDGAVPAVQQLTDQAGGVFAAYSDALVSTLLDAEDEIGTLIADVQVLTRASEPDDGRAVVTVTRVDGYAVSAEDDYDIAFDAACPSGEPEECFGDVGALLSVDDLHVVVAQDAGGWVVDPYATVWSYVVGAVRGLDAETFYSVLRDADLEALVPPSGELVVGQQAEVTTNAAGYAVLTAQLPGGDQHFAAYAGDSAYADVGGPTVLHDGMGFTTTGPETVTVVVQGDAETRYPVVLQTEDAHPNWPLGESVSGSLAWGQCLGASSYLQYGDLVEVQLSTSGGGVQVLPNWMYTEWGESAEGNLVLQSTYDGENLLEVCNEETTPADFTLTLAAYEDGSSVTSGASVDGASSVDGFVRAGSPTSHLLYVPAFASVTVTVQPDADLDVYVTVYSPGGTSTYDSYFEGDAEAVSYYGGSSGGYADLEIGVFGSSPASSGGYTITVR